MAEFAKYGAGLSLCPSNRAALLNSVVTVDHPLARAPVLERSIDPERSTRVSLSEKDLVEWQEFAAAVNTQLAITLTCLESGDQLAAQGYLRWAMQLNAHQLHNFTVLRREAVLAAHSEGALKSMPSFRSEPLCVEKLEGQSTPLFGARLVAELTDKARSSDIQAALASYGRRGERSSRKRRHHHVQRTSRQHSPAPSPPTSVRSVDRFLAFGPVPVVDAIAGRLALFVDNWKCITNDPWVIETIRGYNLVFEKRPGRQRYQPSPIRFPAQGQRLLSEEVSSLLSKKAIEPLCLELKRHCWISRLFFVPKPDGSIRPIINLQPLNAFLKYSHFKMEGLFLLKDIVRVNDFVAKIDMKDAYFGIRIARRHRKFLAFEWDGKLYQYRALPFGLSPAPYVYSKIMRPVAAFLRRMGMRLVVYLDDWLFLNGTSVGLVRDITFALAVFRSLGVLVNHQKSVLTPQQRIEFLGLVLDTRTWSLSIPESKQERILSQCRKLVTKRSASCVALAELLGRLNSVALACLPVPLFSRRLQCLLARATSSDPFFQGSVKFTDETREDIMWWSENLRRVNGRRLLPLPPAFTLTTDASKLGWGAWCKSGSTGGRWSTAESRCHINQLELQACFFGLKTFSGHLHDVHVRLRIDNTTAIAYINRLGGTTNRDLSELARSIWQWAWSRRLHLSAEHIPGTENVLADEESRVFRCSAEWRLRRSVVRRIFAHWGQCSHDLFATRLNAQVELFFSLRPDPEAAGIDAFAQSWAGLTAYAFPPFSQIGRVVQKALQEDAELLLIAPVWPAQAWFPLLLAYARRAPRLLRPRLALLRDPADRSVPKFCENPNFRLSAWKISANVGRIKGFRDQLERLSSSRGRKALAANITLPSPGGVAGVVEGRLIRFDRQLF